MLAFAQWYLAINHDLLALSWNMCFLQPFLRDSTLPLTPSAPSFSFLFFPFSFKPYYMKICSGNSSLYSKAQLFLYFHLMLSMHQVYQRLRNCTFHVFWWTYLNSWQMPNSKWLEKFKMPHWSIKFWKLEESWMFTCII